MTEENTVKPAQGESLAQSVQKLLDIMVALRHPENGCPWDLKQDFRSISAYTIEEAYEVADAIERNDLKDLKGELGDLLFQVAFHSRLAEEQGEFDFADVVDAINEKMLRRHPHVFGDVKEKDEQKLNAAWEQQKQLERGAKDDSDADGKSELDGIASTLPALRWAEKIQRRAAHTGFDWPTLPPVVDKLDEEVAELKLEIDANATRERIEDELGDVLFACVNIARHLSINPEQALRKSTHRFIKRFKQVEQQVQEINKVMRDCDIAELEAFWQKAKQTVG